MNLVFNVYHRKIQHKPYRFRKKYILKVIFLNGICFQIKAQSKKKFQTYQHNYKQKIQCSQSLRNNDNHVNNITYTL